MTTLRDEDWAAGQPTLERLYPRSGEVALSGLYLAEDLRALVGGDGGYVYSNFVSSLDGRIAIARSASARLGVPPQTANARDWRLLLELAAPADAVLISGRYLREIGAGSAQSWPPFSGETPSDLLAFRADKGLAPQPVLVVVSRTLEFPPRVMSKLADRRLIVATIDQACAAAMNRARDAGAEVLQLGSGSVDGRRLIAALVERGLRLIYSTAGPAVLHMLLSSDVLQRLYLTTVLRILAGEAYATLARGAALDPPYDFELGALYLDRHGPDGVPQCMQVYDRRRKP